MDFYSPKHLADYLSYLSENQTAYNSYFAWKKHVSFLDYSVDDFNPLCTMCIHLQLEEYFGIRKSRIDDVETYWSSKLNCKEPKINNVKLYQI